MKLILLTLLIISFSVDGIPRISDNSNTYDVVCQDVSSYNHDRYLCKDQYGLLQYTYNRNFQSRTDTFTFEKFGFITFGNKTFGFFSLMNDFSDCKNLIKLALSDQDVYFDIWADYTLYYIFYVKSNNNPFSMGSSYNETIVLDSFLLI
jgi:hypothetical protein